MATVKMIRDSRIADIFDSPETIAQAEKDGFVRYEEVKYVRQAETKAETPKDEDAEVKTPKSKRQ